MWISIYVAVTKNLSLLHTAKSLQRWIWCLCPFSLTTMLKEVRLVPEVSWVVICHCAWWLASNHLDEQVQDLPWLVLISIQHSGMFPEVLFRCENIDRQRDFAYFWHFLTWIQSFLKPIEFLGLRKVNWVEKRLQSCEKMSKICEIILSADVFTRKQNHEKHSTVHGVESSFWQRNIWYKSEP